ncbi:MAG: hypothetical protein FWG50_14145, partial [Kiritimatiellaeota bacterium]|nr:hypothetical protein [Kiritimatiellota bacterium]
LHRRLLTLHAFGVFRDGCDNFTLNDDNRVFSEKLCVSAPLRETKNGDLFKPQRTQWFSQ